MIVFIIRPSPLPILAAAVIIALVARALLTLPLLQPLLEATLIIDFVDLRGRQTSF